MAQSAPLGPVLSIEWVRAWAEPAERGHDAPPAGDPGVHRPGRKATLGRIADIGGGRLRRF